MRTRTSRIAGAAVAALLLSGCMVGAQEQEEGGDQTRQEAGTEIVDSTDEIVTDAGKGVARFVLP